MVSCVYTKLHNLLDLSFALQCDFCSGVTNNFLLILSALSLISDRETGWYLGGPINSSATSLLRCDLETEEFWSLSWHVNVTVSCNSMSIQ